MYSKCPAGLAAAISALCCLFICGCPPDEFDNTVPVNATTIGRITMDDDLTPQQKRDALAALGFSQLVINALLVEERTGNQFGGDLRSALEKVSEGRFTELTPDEVQIYGDSASEADTTDALALEIIDAEAQAIVDFFVDENISTETDLDLFLTDTPDQVPSGVPDNVLRELFIDFDPSRLNELVDEPPKPDDEDEDDGDSEGVILEPS